MESKKQIKWTNELIEKFADYTNMDFTIKNEQIYGKYISSKSCRISIMDVNSIKILINRFKLIDNKTYNPCSLDCLDTTDKFLSFFTGLVDGDGCITQGNNKKGNKKANMLRIQCHSSWIQVYEEIGNHIKKSI